MQISSRCLFHVWYETYLESEQQILISLEKTCRTGKDSSVRDPGWRLPEQEVTRKYNYKAKIIWKDTASQDWRKIN